MPGAMTDVEDDAEAEEVAARLGYPVLLKAAAGGGGKGIRFVRHRKTCYLLCAPLVVKPGALLAIAGCISRKLFLLPVISKSSLLLTNMVTLCTWVNVSAAYNAVTRS